MTQNELIIFINTFSSTVITLIIVNSYENKSRFQFDGFEINEKKVILVIKFTYNNFIQLQLYPNIR